jgi:hypothetical protein
MRVGDYLRMLARNRFRIDFLRIGLSLTTLFCTTVSSVLALVQRPIYGRRIRRAVITSGPLFVLGHWRTGTTMLHELLAKDPRMAYPTTYQVFAPHHFLVSTRFIQPIIKLVMPARRVMDNMPTGVDVPQEDEFALCALGLPTPYRYFAFWRHGPVCQELLDMQNIDPAVEQQFHAGLDYFLRALTVCHGRRLVIKSPPHTGRLGRLAAWYPDSRFVHISRHPMRVIPSTLHMLRVTIDANGFQLAPPDEEPFVDYVFDCFERMYRGYLAAVDRLPANRLVEIRFEDLVAEPTIVLEDVYQRLELGDFEPAREGILAYLRERRDFKQNKPAVSPELVARIRRQCAEYMERFGYD